MSVASPLYTLLKSNFRAWVSAKGFWLVAAAALLPLVLTGAWVGAHRADVELSDFRIEGDLQEGQEVLFLATVTNVGPIAVGGFNATISVHEPGSQFASAINITPIDRLEPGQSRDFQLAWNASGGVAFVIAQADASSLLADTDQLAERDEFNNYDVEPLAVPYNAATVAPSAPMRVFGDNASTTEVDLVVENITSTPADATVGDTVTLAVTVRNNGAADVTGADVTVRAARAFGTRATLITQNETMDLAAGESKTLTLDWNTVDGSFWLEGFVIPPNGTRELVPENNHRAQPLVVNAVVTDDMRPPEPEARATIKEFYLEILTGLHLTLLVPLIALFYATGVIADEKERGSLAYVITRPIPRWMIPITKFIASFLVAAVAIVLGVVITYAFLFGTTAQGSDIGFLTTPLLATLLALFAYGALFTFIGTWIDRPYLVGLGYILAGLILPLWSVPFVRNAGLPFHLNNALSEWRLDQGLQWLPGTPEAVRAVWVLLAIGVGFLALAGWQMRRREFVVG